VKHVSLVFAFLAAVGSTLGQTLDCGCVPGWKQDGAERSFEPDNLFDYMNGNAEGYLIYRFVGMKGVTCKSGEDTILIDVSEMEDPEFAYGIFCANRDIRQPAEAIGMGGQVLHRKATFAKDKYYVEFSAHPEKDHSVALRAFATAIEKSIDGRRDPPEIIGWFPKQRLVAESVRLVPVSVLGLPLLKSGYVAQYEFGKGFLVREESAEAAAQVMTRLKARLNQTVAVTLGEEAFTGTDRYLDGLCVFRKGRYIGGFANLKSGVDGPAETAKLEALVKYQ
jgi:hypothetical protein